MTETLNIGEAIFNEKINIKKLNYIINNRSKYEKIIQEQEKDMRRLDKNYNAYAVFQKIANNCFVPPELEAHACQQPQDSICLRTVAFLKIYIILQLPVAAPGSGRCCPVARLSCRRVRQLEEELTGLSAAKLVAKGGVDEAVEGGEVIQLHWKHASQLRQEKESLAEVKRKFNFGRSSGDTLGHRPLGQAWARLGTTLQGCSLALKNRGKTVGRKVHGGVEYWSVHKISTS